MNFVITKWVTRACSVTAMFLKRKHIYEHHFLSFPWQNVRSLAPSLTKNIIHVIRWVKLCGGSSQAGTFYSKIISDKQSMIGWSRTHNSFFRHAHTKRVMLVKRSQWWLETLLQTTWLILRLMYCKWYHASYSQQHGGWEPTLPKNIHV